MTYKFERRLMLFVDGTNFQTQLIKKLGYKFDPKKNPPVSIYSFSRLLIQSFLKKIGFKDKQIQPIFIRNFWFASYKGIDGNKEKYDEIYRSLRDSEFEPYIFSREKNDKEKGVDITLTKELLVNAFNQNFEVGVLVTGDKDYLELVKEVKKIRRSNFWNVFQ